MFSIRCRRRRRYIMTPSRSVAKIRPNNRRHNILNRIVLFLSGNNVKTNEWKSNVVLT